MDALPITPWQGGLVGILLSVVVAIIYAVLRGKLVPRSVIDDLRKDREKDLSRSVEIIDLWKDQVEKRDQIISEIVPTLKEVKDNGKTLVALFEALKKELNHQTVGGSQ